MTADTAPAADVQPKAKIFISYSRKDMAFADRLEGALKARGLWSNQRCTRGSGTDFLNAATPNACRLKESAVRAMTNDA